MSKPSFRRTAVVALFSFVTACSTSPSLSSTDQVKVAGLVSTGASLAAITSLTGLASFGTVANAQAVRSLDAFTSGSAIPAVTSPLTGSINCPSSGNTSVTGTAINNINSSGNGTASISLSLTFSSCNGNGVSIATTTPLTYAGNFNFTAFKLTGTTQFAFSGVIGYTASGRTGTMTYDCTVHIDATTFQTTGVTGTVTVQGAGGGTTTGPCTQYGIG